MAKSDQHALEFCSDAWLARAGGVLEQLVAEAGSGLAGMKFSGCEVFTDPPAHLRLNGENRTYWYFCISEGASAATREDRDDVDFRVVADYRASLVTARTLYTTPPGAPGQPPPKLPLPLARLFFELHNRLAAVTA